MKRLETIIAALIILALLPGALWAAHTYDTKANLVRGRNAAGRDITYTCGSGATVLTLSIVVDGLTARTGGAPTYNSVAMTQASTNAQAASGETTVELWYLLNPPTGSALTIHIPDDNNMYFTAEASSYKATSEYTSILRTANKATGTSTNPTGPSHTGLIAGDVIVAVVGTGATTWNPSGRTGTQLYDVDDGSYGDGAQYFITTTTNNVAMAWTFGTSDDWAIVSAVFKESLLHNLSTTITSTTASSTPVLTTFSTFNLTTTIAAVTFSSSVISPMSVYGDWPDYSTVPQMDHYWDLADDYSDTEKSGKDDLTLTAGGAGPTWVDDWAGRSNQGLGSFSYANHLTHTNHADICNLGATWSLFFEVEMSNQIATGEALLSTRGTNNYGFSIQKETDGSMVIYGNGIYQILNTTTNLNKYQYLLSYSGGNLTWYINGVYIDSVAMSTPVASDGGIYIGCNYVTGAYWQGKIYRVGVIKGTALNSTQATSLYDTWVNAGSGVYKRHCNSVETASTTTAKITRNLVSAIASVTALSAAVLDITGGSTYNLVTTIASVVTASSPIGKITRALTTAANATTQAGAAVMVFIHNLVSALLSVTASASAALMVTRNLSGAASAVTAGGTPTLPVSRNLSTTITSVTTSSTPVLTVTTIRNLVTTIQAVTAGSSPPLPVARKLVTTLSAQTQAATITLNITGLIQLVTNIEAVTTGSTPILGITRQIASVIQSVTALSQGALKITRKLVSLIQTIITGSTPESKIDRRLTSTVNSLTQLSAAELSLNRQINLVTAIQIVTSAAAAAELRIFTFPKPSYATLIVPAENRNLAIDQETRRLNMATENRTLKLGG